MPDQPPSAAQSLYPDLPSASAPAPAPAEGEMSPAAKALYGKTPVAKPSDGTSPLGGQAVRSSAAPDNPARPSLLSSGAPPGDGTAPAKPEPAAEAFDPVKLA